MSFQRWLYLILAVVLVLIVLLFVRMHGAAAQVIAGPANQVIAGPANQVIAGPANQVIAGPAKQVIAGPANAEAGRLSAQAWCTECHSVQRETAGTGKFAPDFTVIASRRSARWLHAFLRSKHVLMPDFEFHPHEADDLVAYIVGLRRR
jgi:hypothetical protein